MFFFFENSVTELVIEYVSKVSGVGVGVSNFESVAKVRFTF